ncbi:winged helix-turn-helix domain-containing protein [Kribbella sp. NBC_01505]|uniref:AfsR/SARP family transcriptional regulator n=1 Tax=Kribbella sp. NBC_01505 TaxID=2903580 RepID=UPI00386C8B52
MGGPQQRALLALLLLEANRVVSADRLIAELWADEPPVMARSLLHGCVARLRKVLAVGGRQPLERRGPGYVLQVLAGELDLDRVEALADEAAAEPDEGRRAGLLREAAGLWRGPTLDGIEVETCRSAAVQLEDRRLGLCEQRIEIELRQGRFGGLVSELRQLIATYPLRERLWALLMAVSYATARQAEALAAYGELRARLVAELGTEPTALIRELHGQMLVGTDPAELLIPCGRPQETATPLKDERTVPAQLPAGSGEFVGRSSAFQWLARLLDDLERRVPIGVVCGSPGVGKTALAVQWAHLVRERFPDGQLYVNLQGYSSTAPVSAEQALAGFLRALGVPSRKIPVDLEEAAALYRSMVDGRRVLVVLDNARSAAQIRPLLPGAPGCMALVTGRGGLGGVVARDGGQLLTLDVLSADEATELFVGLLGAGRVAAEPEASADLVRLCAGLPLAVRIAGAHLAGHPGQRIDALVSELRAERLDVLALDDDESAVRIAFDRSYDAQAPEAARVFRLLSLIPGLDVTAETTAVLADIAVPVARRLLAGLASAHLIQPLDTGRFGLHDLLRIYAYERLLEEERPEDRAAATDRLVTSYLARVEGAARSLWPEVLRMPGQGSGQPADLVWLDVERPNLVAAVVHAAKHGPKDVAARLSDALRGYFWLRRHSVDWLTVAEAGRAAAQDTGDLHARAAAEFSLGMASLCLNRYPLAVEHQVRALTFSDEAGWDEGVANALGNLGMIQFELGELSLAMDGHRRALEVNQRIDSRRGQIVNLANLAHVYLVAGRPVEAAAYLAGSLRAPDLRGGYGKAFTSYLQALLAISRGEFEKASGYLDAALPLYRSIGNINGEAMALAAFAQVHSRRERPAVSRDYALDGLKLIQGSGDRYTEACLRNQLGTALHALGHRGQAIDQFCQTLTLARDAGFRYSEVEALIGLAICHQSNGSSTEFAGEAVQLAKLAGYRHLLRDAEIVGQTTSDLR